MQSRGEGVPLLFFFYSPCSSDTAIFSIVCVLNNFPFQNILSLSKIQGHDWITNKKWVLWPFKIAKPSNSAVKGRVTMNYK